jgi:hypothetical protein
MIIDTLKEKYKHQLFGYKYFDSDTCSNIPKGVHIKIIDRYGNLYNKGFLIGITNIDKPSRICIITRSYNKNKCMKIINYYFFYKKVVFTKRELFINLLDTISINK